MTSPKIAKPRRPPPVLICRKCLKRSDGGRAIARALKGELKARSRASGEKRAKMVMTSCFGLCPKRAVVATSGPTLARGEFVLLRDEAEASGAVEMLASNR